MKVKLIDSSTEEEVVQLKLDCIPRVGEKLTYTFDDSWFADEEDDEIRYKEGYEKMKDAQGRYRIDAVEHAVETTPKGMFKFETKQTVLLLVTKLV